MFSTSFYILFLLTILWFCFMTWLSHQNGNDTAKTSRHLAEGLSSIFRSKDLIHLNGILRKAAHVVVFTVLTLLVLLTMMAGKIEGRWIALCLIALWSFMDEATKPLIQGRHFSWRDVGLNLIGVVIGSLLGAMIALI